MVENLSLWSLQKKVEEWYEKYNDWINWRKYSQELRLWCKQVISQIKNKTAKWFDSIKNKEKLKSDYDKNFKIFSEKSDKIAKDIEWCCNSWSYVRRAHKDRLNKLAWWIDNYENTVVTIVNDLIKQDKEMSWVTAKEKETWKNYFSVKNWVYTLTKDVNAPKIHEVFDGVIKPWEKWLIDYSGCTNSAIKNKMLNTMWSYSCYLHYDEKTKTYVVSSWEIEEDDNGNKRMGVSTQRALIREWVKITPNSKITKDAKATIEANARKEANKEISNDEKSKLKQFVPTKLRNQLNDWKHRDEFFKNTEKDIKQRILEAKSAGYELAWEVCSKTSTKNWRILEIHFIQKNAEVDRPLLTTKFSDKLYDILDDREWDLVAYMKARIPQLWDQLDYATKYENVWIWKQVQWGELTKEKKEESDKLKSNAVYWLWLLQRLVDNMIEDEWNSVFDNDDKRLADCKKYLKNVIYSIGESDILTVDDLNKIKNTLTDKLWPYYEAKWFDHRWRSLTFSKKWISDQLNNVIFGTKNEAVRWIRTLWAWTTVFDNEMTTFLRDEIIENANVETATLNETRANNCFKNIQKFFVSVEKDIENVGEWDGVKLELNSDKKDLIDGLYRAAEASWEETLLKYMQDKGIMSKHSTLNNKKVKELVKNIKNYLNTKSKNIDKTLSWINAESIRQWLIQKKNQLEASNNLSEDQIKELNYYNFAIQMPSEYFEKMVESEKQQLKILKYQWVDDVLRSNLTPWLVKEWWWITWIDNADILNDSIWAWWAFDRSDENCAKIWPILTEIITEVIITAVSIALSWTWAWEAIYASFRAAKAAASAMKWIQKFIKFMTTFAKTLAKSMAKEFASKFSVRAGKSAKTVKNASQIVKWAEELRWIQKAKHVWQTLKTTETLGSVLWKVAMKWTSLLIEWTTFHINSTLIHNAINGGNLGDGLNPFDYTEWPDGEKIPNRKSYAQSIAFLWVLKTLGKPIQSVTWDVWKFFKTKLSSGQIWDAIWYVLWLGWEMWSMMMTDQILSLTFDHQLKEVTGEDLVMMFGMVAWLRLNWKFQMKIQEYDRKSVTLEMKQWENIFNVKIDRDWNVLKVEWKDASGKKIQNPEKILGIKSKVDWENLRTTRAGQEVWTIEWNIRELWNLHEWDMITVKRGEKNIKLTKNKNGNWEISDAWGIESERFKPWEEYIVKKNWKDSWYHLETKVEGWPKITLESEVKVKFADRKSSWEVSRSEWSNSVNQKSDAPDGRMQELLGQKEELLRKKENQDRRKWELEQKKKTLESKKNNLLRQREANWKSLDNSRNDINQITEVLAHDNIVTIDWVKYKYNKIKNEKAEFIIATKDGINPNTVEVSSLSELLDSRFNLEPWKKWTNSWRYDKLHKLLNEKVEPLDRLQNKIRNKTLEVQTLTEEITRLEKWNNTVAHNDYFASHKQELVWKKLWIDGVKYSAERINPDGTLQFKQVDGKDNFTVSSFDQLAKKWQVNGFSDGIKQTWNWEKSEWKKIDWSESLTEWERQNHELITNLVSGEKDYIAKRDVNETLKQKKSALQAAQQELEWLESKLPASRARQQAIDERAQKWKEINKELRQVEKQLDKINRDLWETDRLAKKYQNEIDQIDKDLSEKGESKEEVKDESKEEVDNNKGNMWKETEVKTEDKGQELEQWIEKPEDVENKINEMLSNKTNTWNYKNLKLDWVKQWMFEKWIFIEWVKNRIKNLKPGTIIPKEFLKNLRDKLVDMGNRFWKKLSEYHSKLVDSIKSAIDQKLAKVEAENIVKDIKKINLPIWNEYDLWNWEKIRLKKLENWKFVETEKFWWKTLDETFIEVHKWSEMTEWELVEFLKRKIVENMNKQPQYIEKQDRQRQIEAEAKAKAEADRQRQTETNRQSSNERPERWINTERREMSEVQRKSDVVAIWDLHGQYIALKWNMEYAWLAKEVNWHLEWTGWNKKVVFQWDILADRWTDWLRIIEEIHNLREQARKQWWDIDIIVGNHDDFMISFLTQRGGVHWKWIEVANHPLAPGQGLWLTELAKFIGWKVWDFDIIGWQQNNILKAMRESPEWRLILEEICNMKLVSQVDDVLYLHTNPTPEILEYLTKWNIQENINLVNQKYQWYLRNTLLWTWNKSITTKEFNKISDIFLNTDNRNDMMFWIDRYCNRLKGSWINMISHGHNWGHWYRNTEIWWVKIVDTDYSYWKRWSEQWQHSVSIVKKEWWVNYIWDNIVYANLEYPIWTEVYVKRSAWWESKAKVDSYNPTTKEYRVVWEEWWEILYKDVTIEGIRGKDWWDKLHINKEKSEQFDQKIMSEEWVNINWDNYKLEYVKETKGRVETQKVIWLRLIKNWKTKKAIVIEWKDKEWNYKDIKELLNEEKWVEIWREYYRLKDEYIGNNHEYLQDVKWSRNDVNTLVEIIEKWIKWDVLTTIDIFKSDEIHNREIQACLDKLVLNEYNAHKEIWIKEKLTELTKRLTWPEKEYAEKVLKKYEKMTQDLKNDKYWDVKNKIQDRLNKFVDEREINSIIHFWNDFSRETVLYNRWSVPSIAVWQKSYDIAKNIIGWNEKFKWKDLLNTEWDYWKKISDLNECIDKFIREKFNTDNLQELNSTEHRASYDHIVKKLWLWDGEVAELGDLINIKWVQDCRLHAFTKQLLFDTRRNIQIDLLKTEISKYPKNSEKYNDLSQKLMIVENTKMEIVSASFSWKIDMEGMYAARTSDWYMLKWGHDNLIIEEHTFNMIEIPTIENWKIIGKRAYFADSFYQWNWWKIYDLSYGSNSWNPITVEWKNKDFTMKTKVQCKDFAWNTSNIDIKIKPLEWSRRPLWSSPEWAKIVTIDPKTVKLLENDYNQFEKISNFTTQAENIIKDNLNKLLNEIDIWRKDIASVFDKACRTNQNIKRLDIDRDGNWLPMRDGKWNLKLKRDINENIILKETDYHLNEREKDVIKRSMERYTNMRPSEREQYKPYLKRMIEHITTVEGNEFTYKKWELNSEAITRESIFLENAEHFNRIDRKNFDDLIKKGNANDIMSAFEKCKANYESDISQFIDRYLNTVENDNARKEGAGKEYHRNNFEKIAERFNVDAEKFKDAYDRLTELWEHEKAYEIKEFIVKSHTKILEQATKYLQDYIDFKSVKKSIKWINWREWIWHLESIKSDIEAWHNVNIDERIDQLLWKKWAAQELREKLWTDLFDGKRDNQYNKNKKRDINMLEKAIDILKEQNKLQGQYEIIKMVYDPKIQKMLMEDAVYGDRYLENYDIIKGGHNELNRWKAKFWAEDKWHYVKRMNDEIKFEKDLGNKWITEVKDIITKKLTEITSNSTLKNEKARTMIQNEISKLIDLCEKSGITSSKDIYSICKMCTEALVYETLESNTRNMGDHGINHIKWNIDRLNNYIESYRESWKISGLEANKYKLMWMITHIFHDIWYAAEISRWWGNFDGSWIHPFTSKEFFDQNVRKLLGDKWLDLDLISKAIESHDGIRLDFRNPKDAFLSFVNLSDNMALWVDKIPELQSNPLYLKYVSFLFKANEMWINIADIREWIMKDIDSKIKDPLENAMMKSAIFDLSWRSLDNLDFWTISPKSTISRYENGVIPVIEMYIWENIDVVAGINRIERNELKTAMENHNTEAIFKLIENTKFWQQMVKPLKDYMDIYEIRWENNQIYEMTEDKWKVDWYNRNQVIADLLAWKEVSFVDSEWKTVAKYKYNGIESTVESWSLYADVGLNILKDVVWIGSEAIDIINKKMAINLTWDAYKSIKKLEKLIEKTDNFELEIEEVRGNVIRAREVIKQMEEFGVDVPPSLAEIDNKVASMTWNNTRDVKQNVKLIKEYLGILSRMISEGYWKVYSEIESPK